MADYTLRIQKARGSDEFFEMDLKEVDEQIFMAAYAYIRKEKELEAVKVIIANCWVSGEPKETILNNFQYLRAATRPITEFLAPLEGELKKN